MTKRLEKILDLLIIFSLAVVLFVLTAGSRRFEFYGIIISISSPKSPLRWFAVLLFLKHIITGKEGILLRLLKRKLDFLSRFFSFERDSNSETIENRKLLLNAVFFCGMGAIAIGLGNITGYINGPFSEFYISSELPQPYYSRFLFVINFVLFYGLGGLIAGYVLKLIWSLLAGLRLKPFEKEKKYILQLDVILIAVIFLITSSSRFKLINAHFLTDFQTTDLFLAPIALLILVFAVPFSILAKQYRKIISAMIFIILIPFYYLYGGYREDKISKENRSLSSSSVVLVTIDTTRADHLGMYGYGRNTTPNLDAIAKEGVVFTRAYVQMQHTDPSHASILTGVYPRTHGLYANGMGISNSEIPHLAEWFKKKGYISAAITSRALLDPETMKLKGFDYTNLPNYLYKKAKKDGGIYSVTADITYKRAVEWIDRYGKKPFFLWVHFWDPHREYNPPAPYNAKFNNGYRGMVKIKRSESKGIKSKFLDPKNRYTSDEVEYITSLYDGEIAFADGYVFKLVKYIEKRTGMDSNPLFIITSDHGETLGEVQDRLNYAFNHSQLVRYGQIHVPLLFIWKGVISEGRVIDAIVESVDIAPTIVELLDRNDKYICDGKSFAKLLSGGKGEGKEFAYAQRRIYGDTALDFLNVPEYAVVNKKWFLIFNEKRGSELYDISTDTLEQKDLSEEKKEIVDMLLAKLDSWKKAFPMTRYKREKVSDEKKKVLRSLGYIQ